MSPNGAFIDLILLSFMALRISMQKVPKSQIWEDKVMILGLNLAFL